MEYFKINNSYLITKDIEDIEKIDNKTINIIPLYKWLLEFNKHT
jgi:predicted AAA+ superfamily ATPase